MKTSHLGRIEHARDLGYGERILCPYVAARLEPVGYGGSLRSRGALRTGCRRGQSRRICMNCEHQHENQDGRREHNSDSRLLAPEVWFDRPQRGHVDRDQGEKRLEFHISFWEMLICLESRLDRDL